jgi:protein-S-isoprenylcysteine O-methyltransferase Ste14
MTAQNAAIAALSAYVLFLLLAFGLRSFVHYRRTGSLGFVGISGAPGSAEWSGGMLFVLALAAGGVAPVLQLAGFRLGPDLDLPSAHAVGVGLFLLGIGATLWAQFAMGNSWRIGVDQTERTALVQSGPFRWVRNPIFSAMTLATAGLVLLVPTLVSLFALATLIAALEIQVRLVEEPYLRRSHGEPYRRYAQTTGRFLPGIGRVAW